MHNNKVDGTKKQLIKNWHDWGIEDKLPVKLDVPLQPHHLTVIKSTKVREIWMINAPLREGIFPLILKIHSGKPFITKQKEWLLFSNLKDTVIKKFMPISYDIQTCNENETWIFMEYLTPFVKEKNLTVDHLYRMVIKLAQLHVATFEGKPAAELISNTIPGFQSEERTQHLKTMKDYLTQAKNHDVLKTLIERHCPELYDLAELDLDFPEVIDSGRCLNHGDLHIGNICYDFNNQIKFIDFSAVTYSAGWLDLAKLVEFMMDHHPEWSISKKRIRRRAIDIYIKIMKKGGVTFNGNCYRLYKLAYIMTVFEKELRRHLKSILDGKNRYIFPNILNKISKFSRDLNLLG